VTVSKVYYPDGASYQAGWDLSGWGAAMVKATEGTGYTNPYYGAQRTEAARRGAHCGAYHFLHAGNAAAQAGYAAAVIGPVVPTMLDMEPTMAAAARLANQRARPAGLEDGHLARLAAASSAPAALASSPTVADAAAFTDGYRAKGGVLHLLYLPWWYWVQLGRPSLAPLAARGLHLVTSNYSAISPEDPAHPGWVSYGGMPPVETLQYTASGNVNGTAADLNCCRGSGTKDAAGTLAELWSLWTTGTLGGTPVDPTISEGAAGPAVVKLQARLNAWGAKLTADGQFGPATLAAVESFQHAHNLTVDGVAGPATWWALNTTPPPLAGYHGAYTADGHLSLAQIAEHLTISTNTLLRETAVHYGAFDPLLAGYIAGVFAGTTVPSALVPAGARFWVN
jgi:hypothetical protein